MKKKITFAVSNLRRADIFLGHKWLKHHNPTINWTKSQVDLDRCPSTCHYVTHMHEIEEEPEKPFMNQMTKKINYPLMKEIIYLSMTLIRSWKSIAQTMTMSRNMIQLMEIRRIGMTLSHNNTTSMKISLEENILTNYLNKDLGTIELTPSF